MELYYLIEYMTDKKYFFNNFDDKNYEDNERFLFLLFIKGL